MDIPDQALCIQYHYQRHASEFEDIHLLSVSSSNMVFRVRQSDERQTLRSPVLTEGIRPVRSNSKNLGPAAGELRVVIPEARQLRTAIWSQEAAQERHDDVPATIVRESDESSAGVPQLEVRSTFTESTSLSHAEPVDSQFARSRRTWQG